MPKLPPLPPATTENPLAAALDIPINDRAAMERLMIELGVSEPRKPTKPTGYWIPYAWMVRLMVETTGMGVAPAVRVILRRVGVKVTPETENCLRVVSYKVRRLPWPKGMRGLLSGVKFEESGDTIVDEPISDEPEVEGTVGRYDPADEPEPESAVVHTVDSADEEDYIDDALREELLEEERRVAESRRAADERAAEERRLLSQINVARGRDPDADEGYTAE